MDTPYRRRLLIFPVIRRLVHVRHGRSCVDSKGTVSRAAGSVTFPSEFMLVAAMNPCPCGYFGDLKRECRCGPVQVQRYRQRISGPLLDRIDLHIEVPAVEYRDVASERAEESSTAIRDRIMRTRERQQERFHNDPKVTSNARMATRHLKQHCKLNQDSQDLISAGMNELNSAPPLTIAS